MDPSVIKYEYSNGHVQDDEGSPPGFNRHTTGPYNEQSIISHSAISIATNPRWKYKLIKSFFLFNAWVGMGIWASLPSPCIDTLREFVGCNYEEISRPLAMKMVGIMVGSILVGLLTDKFKKHINLIICLDLLFAGLSIMAIPWVPNLIVMSVFFFINGMAHGGLSAAGNAHAIDIWGKDAASPLLCIHMGYSIGTILGPVLIAPFLASAAVSNNTSHNGNSTMLFQSASMGGQALPLNIHSKSIYVSLFEEEQCLWCENLDESYGNNGMSNLSAANVTTAADIRVPFGTAGAYTIVVSAVFLAYACFAIHNSDSVPRYALRRKPSVVEIMSPGTCTDGNTGYGVRMFILIFILFSLFSAKDTCVTSFLQPIAVHTPTLDFTIKQADLLITVHYACYAIGRIVVAIIAKFITIKVLICLELVSIIGVQVSIALFGLKSNLNFWITTSVYALISGPNIPSGISWIDRYVKMTAFGVAIINTGIGAGGFLFQWLCGYIYNYMDHQWLYYVTLICGVVELLILIVMQVLGSSHGDRYHKLRDANRNEILKNGEHDDNYEQSNGDTSPLIAGSSD